MLNVLYAELLKLRRSKLLWLVVIGALLPVVMLAFVDFQSLRWEELLTNNLLLLHVMMGPLLLTLIAGYVVVREYGDKTVNQLLVYPHRRVSILLGKTIVILLLTAAMLGLNFGLIVLSGSLIGDQPISEQLFGKYAQVYMWMFAMQTLLIPLAMTAGLVGKSYIPPVVLGIVGILLNVLAVSGISDHHAGRVLAGSYLPFGSALVHAMGNISEKNHFSNVVHPLYPHGIAFIVFLAFNAIYFAKSEVHSGS